MPELVVSLTEPIMANLELTIRLILNCLAVLPPHSLTPPLAIALALAIGMAIKLWVSLTDIFMDYANVHLYRDIPQSACPSLIRCVNGS